LGGSIIALICRVACRPSSTGMRTSIRITSGRSAAARLTASAPFTASPMTSMSGSLFSRVVKPDRTMPWSSAITTRTVTTSPPPGGWHLAGRR
jgi:hypothetical protein